MRVLLEVRDFLLQFLDPEWGKEDKREKKDHRKGTENRKDLGKWEGIVFDCCKENSS